MLPCIVIDLLLNNQPDALIIPVLFCYKTLHVSGILSAHHQEFSTVHSALVSFMQVFLRPFPSRVRMELAVRKLSMANHLLNSSYDVSMDSSVSVVTALQPA
jgi:hypothetical protein